MAIAVALATTLGCSGGGATDEERQLACSRICGCLDAFVDNIHLDPCPGRCLERLDLAPDPEGCIEAAQALPSDADGCREVGMRDALGVCGHNVTGYCLTVNAANIAETCD